MTERFTIWLAWRLPRYLVRWCFIRLATAGFDGPPNSRRIGAALRSWDTGKATKRRKCWRDKSPYAGHTVIPSEPFTPPAGESEAAI